MQNRAHHIKTSKKKARYGGNAKRIVVIVIHTSNSIVVKTKDTNRVQIMKNKQKSKILLVVIMK